MEAGDSEGRDEDGASLQLVGEVALAKYYTLSEIGQQLTDPTLSYSDFEQVCERIGDIYAAIRILDAEVRFTIGDAILAGEMLFGEEAYQAFEHFDVSEEVRRECVRISRKVPRSTRKLKRLSWSHHRAVAALPPVEQKQWLKRAVDEGMSHHQLRDHLSSRNGSEPVEYCERCGRRL